MSNCLYFCVFFSRFHGIYSTHCVVFMLCYCFGNIQNMMAFFSDNLVSGFSCHIESLAGFLCAFFMSVENKEHVVSEPQVIEYWNQNPAH